MKKYPQFSNQDLRVLVKKLAAKEKRIKKLQEERDFLEERLDFNIFRYTLNYELLVEYDNKPYGYMQFWVDSDQVNDLKNFDEIVETDKEAVNGILVAKTTIENLIGKNVKVRPYHSQYDGIIKKYNITWEQITKGIFSSDKSRIIYKKTNPEQVDLQKG